MSYFNRADFCHPGQIRYLYDSETLRKNAGPIFSCTVCHAVYNLYEAAIRSGPLAEAAALWIRDSMIQPPSFLERIQKELRHTCPVENIQLVKPCWLGGPFLYCSRCHKSLNIYKYIKKQPSDRSYELAIAYALWSRSQYAVMNFTLAHVEGILSKTVVGQNLNRAEKSLRFLKALNAPFTHLECYEKFEDMNHDDLTHVLNTPSNDLDADPAGLFLDHVISLVRVAFNRTRTLTMYDSGLVPYVKKCCPEWEPLTIENFQGNLVQKLQFHLQLSSTLRKTFGQFSMEFDFIHVLVSCYACSVDREVVDNYVLDFMARVCRGVYFWNQYPNCIYVRAMNETLERIIATESYTSSKKDIFEIMRKGESAEHYSELSNYHWVKSMIATDFWTHLNEDNPYIAPLAFHQTFPAVCFQKHADFYGFMLTYDTGNRILDKNTIFEKAQEMHKTFEKFICKIQSFNASQWTMATLRLFMASDPDFEKVLEMLQLRLSWETD